MDPIVVDIISCPLERKICRVCLVTGVKMFSLHTDYLNREFCDVTGLQLSADDGLPLHICYICCALLKKATNFRSKCHSSQKLLMERGLSQDFIKVTNLSHEQPLMRTNIVTFSTRENDYSDKNHYSEIKEETFLDYENDNNFDYIDDQSTVGDININTHAEENTTFEDINCLDEKTELCMISHKKIALTEANKSRYNESALENSKSSSNLVNSSFDRLKRFIKHIEDKNIDDTEHKDVIERREDETDSDDDFKPLSSYASVNANDITIYMAKNFNNPENIDKPSCKKNKLHRFYEEKPADKVGNDRGYLKSKRTKKSEKELRTRETIDKFDKTYNFEVVALSIEEQIEVVKARAETKKYKHGKYKCDDCYTGFVVESKFVCHRKTHDPAISGSIECEVCHVRFKTRLQYMKHALRHKYKYICKQCGAVSFSRSFAKNHYECHAGVKYECQYCKQVFSKYATRVNHIRIKHGSVECTICHDLFGAGGLALHLSLAHKQTYKCSSCEQVFNDADALKRHMMSLGGEACDPKLRPCTRCGECFKMEDLDLFNKHIEEHREFKKKERTLTDKMERKGKSKNILASNEDIINNCMNISLKPDNGASDQIGVREKCRGGEKTKLMCEICALDNFKNITALRYHQRIHTGEKPYQCPTCPKKFRLTHTLQWHIRTHTGDRPYACTLCPKAFKTNTALCRHKLVHTNERRHVCNLCGKAFQTSTNVKLHIRTVHMKVPMPPRVRNRKKRAQELGVTS